VNTFVLIGSLGGARGLLLCLWNPVREAASTVRVWASDPSPSLRQHLGLRCPRVQLGAKVPRDRFEERRPLRQSASLSAATARGQPEELSEQVKPRPSTLRGTGPLTDRRKLEILDDKKTGATDRSSINMGATNEVKYWTRRIGTTRERVTRNHAPFGALVLAHKLLEPRLRPGIFCAAVFCRTIGLNRVENYRLGCASPHSGSREMRGAPFQRGCRNHPARRCGPRTLPTAG